MARVQLLSIASLSGLFNLNAVYLTGYAWLFGMSVWVTFFGGIIAYRALPRHQFGALQHKTFPVYFVLSMLLSSGLMAIWTFKHPDILVYLARPNVADVAQFYALATVFSSQALNYFVIGPLTSKTMFQRQRLEKEEGKVYNDPGVSDEMKALNRRFGSLHGISSLANLGAVLALGFHGLWIGNAGVKGY
ncbi:Transmembrane protein 205 [Psilocybe cubensis]|uniref:TMEM205-like domain-containing protein n=2 Tax=Psilocybe cubensis TaxID=181762 RepID=A0A8H7Y8R2_PSICU|nr:Transmembrane protein 205 [Psilocybe cubensis]KAH9487073.1 Transmembrane protein 205 [Psilocybe cubensis]